MGAWGFGPFDNDEAMEWLSNSIEKTILDAVKEKLEEFLANPEDDLLKHEVEAAVALLLDLTQNPTPLHYCQFDLALFATTAGLWDMAISAIRMLKGDTDWLQSWGTPESKIQVLEELLEELEARK